MRRETLEWDENPPQVQLFQSHAGEAAIPAASMKASGGQAGSELRRNARDGRLLVSRPSDRSRALESRLGSLQLHMHGRKSGQSARTLRDALHINFRRLASDRYACRQSLTVGEIVCAC